MYKFILNYHVHVFFILAFVVLYAVSIVKSDLSFTTISNYYTVPHFKEADISSNKKLTWNLTIKDNYFGILVVNFKKNHSANEGEVLFKIKETNKKEWISTNKYDARQFNFLPSYPFGFPPQSNSKGKSYTFELSFVNNKSKVMKLDPNAPFFVSKHQYPKDILISDKGMFLHFLWKKFTVLLRQPIMLNSELLAILVLFYLIYLFINSIKNISLDEYPELKLLLVFVLFEVFFINNYTDIYSLFVLGLWLGMVRLRRIKSRQHFLAIFLLAWVLSVLVVIGREEAANRIAEWIYYLLITGSIHAIIMSIDKRKTRNA